MQHDVEDFSLPEDWNGHVLVQGCVYEDAECTHITSAHALGVEPAFWGLYAQCTDGAWQWLRDFPVQQQAIDHAARLTQ